jgi:hypothetical protein
MFTGLISFLAGPSSFFRGEDKRMADQSFARRLFDIVEYYVVHIIILVWEKLQVFAGSGLRTDHQPA